MRRAMDLERNILSCAGIYVMILVLEKLHGEKNGLYRTGVPREPRFIYSNGIQQTRDVHLHAFSECSTTMPA